jgi:DNA modification methylase
MSYLLKKRNEAQVMLDKFNYELSNEVVNRKLEWQKQIAEVLENDKYNGKLSIQDEYITIETEQYDYMELVQVYKDIVQVCANNGKVYVLDDDDNEYYLDDIDESTFKDIYNSVLDLTKE